VLIFSVVQFSSVFAWTRQTPLELQVPDWYLPGRSIFWGAVSAAAAIGLFFGRSWSLPLTRWSTVAYFIWYVADRLALRSSSYARQALWLYGLLLFLACWLILWILSRSSTRSYLSRSLSDE